MNSSTIKYLYLLFIFLNLSITLPLLGGNTLPDIYTKAPSSSDYKDADAVLIKENIDIILNEDGTQTRRFYQVIKLFSDLAIEQFCDPKLKFDSKNQSLIIKTARTFMNDGKEVVTTPNGFNIITPEGLAKAPFFTSNNEMVVTFMGVEKNAVIEFEYELKDKTAFRPDLDSFEYFRSWVPIIEKNLTITVPKNKKLIYTPSKLDIQPEIMDSGNSIKFKWSAKNIPLLNNENNQKYRKDYTPILFYTTSNSWETVNISLKSDIDKSLQTIPDLIKNKVSEITTDCFSQWEKIIKIHDFVVEDFVTIDYDFQKIQKPRDITTIYNSSYGTLLEKSILLKALLSIENLTAFLYLVPETYTIDIRQNPNLCIIKNVILGLNFDNQIIYLDPSKKISDTNLKEIIGKTLIKIGDKSDFIVLKRISSRDNVNEVKVKVEFDEEMTGKGKFSIKLSNDYTPYFRIKGSMDALDETAKNYLNHILPGAVIEKTFLKELKQDLFELIIDFKDFKLKKDDNGFFKFIVPDNSDTLTSDNYYLYRLNRMTPIFIPFEFTDILQLDLTVPKDAIEKILIPTQTELSNDIGNFSLKVSEKENKLTYTRNLGIIRNIIDPLNYGIFKELICTYKLEKYNIFIFNKLSK
jgi:hypothetical protein